MSIQPDAVAKYVQEHVRLGISPRDGRLFPSTAARFEKALSLLPDETLELFLSGARSLTIHVQADPELPLGMRTESRGSAAKSEYTIIVYQEHLGWPEDLFMGAFLRELGHVVAERPPEPEWPTQRGERARFKELLENRADAMVWRWGLRHYSIRHITATYPSHRVDQILAAIEQVLLDECDA
ncbi:MAG: hypothetical protein HY914_01875 [Desulfomonile tiedjei]|nr:hypothetical protein [Desulfomonile tiedjei]